MSTPIQILPNAVLFHIDKLDETDGKNLTCDENLTFDVTLPAALTKTAPEVPAIANLASLVGFKMICVAAPKFSVGHEYRFVEISASFGHSGLLEGRRAFGKPWLRREGHGTTKAARAAKRRRRPATELGYESVRLRVVQS